VSYYSRGATLVKQRNASGSTLTQSYLHLDEQGTVVVRSLDNGRATGSVQDPDPWGGDPGKRWGRGLVDSFSRPDADVLGNAETGQTWTQVWSPGETKGFGIRSGQARVIPQTVNGYFSAWCPSGQSDVRVKVRLTLGTVIGTPPGTGVGILFRVGSLGSGLLLRYVGGTTNNWRWSRFSTSISDYVAVTGPVLTQGVSYDLEVRASGSNCSAYVDGMQIGGTQTFTNYQTNTYHGFHVFQSTDHLFENFSVLAEADAEPVGWLGDPGYYTEAAVMRRLEYVRARWYQAGGPGWLSKDPLELGGGDVNLYRYAASNPLVFVDPEGQKPAKPYVYPFPPTYNPYPVLGHRGGYGAGYEYGRYCGGPNQKNPGWAIPPQDCLDACCQIHDRCLEAHYGAGYSEVDGHRCCDDNLITCTEWVINSGCCRRSPIVLRCALAAGEVQKGIKIVRSTVYRGGPSKPCLPQTQWPRFVALHWGDVRCPSPQGVGSQPTGQGR
jgi:RHS repeat-associated protein